MGDMTAQLQVGLVPGGGKTLDKQPGRASPTECVCARANL